MSTREGAVGLNKRDKAGRRVESRFRGAAGSKEPLDQGRHRIARGCSVTRGCGIKGAAGSRVRGDVGSKRAPAHHEGAVKLRVPRVPERQGAAKLRAPGDWLFRRIENKVRRGTRVPMD